MLLVVRVWYYTNLQVTRGVGAEAAARAQDRAEPPFITKVTAEGLRHLPITENAWRDHVPDMYLNALRQVRAVRGVCRSHQL